MRRTILPPKLIYRVLQVFNLPPMVSTNGSQVDILLIFAPTGSPKYLKGILPALQFKKSHAMAIKSSLTLIPTNELLEKFIFKAETIWKPLRIAFIVQRFWTEAFPMQSVSSAYCKWETTKSLPLKSNHVQGIFW